MTDEMWGKEMLRGSSHLGSGDQGGRTQDRSK